MKHAASTRWLALQLAATSLGWSVVAARAETPYEADQRQQMQKAQNKSPQVLQAERWEREWKEQHPGQPVPNMGVLQKLHRQETLATMNAGFAQMHARRQAELRRAHDMSRNHQAKILADQHITWTPQQWQAWERQYDREQRQRAQDYLNAQRQAAEIDRMERERQEQEKYFKKNR